MYRAAGISNGGSRAREFINRFGFVRGGCFYRHGNRVYTTRFFFCSSENVGAREFINNSSKLIGRFDLHRNNLAVLRGYIHVSQIRVNQSH